MVDIKIIDDLSTLSILVASCDSYADIWPHFFKLFYKYWPDCPNQVFLGSNYTNYNDPNITPLLIGKDTTWADSTKQMVERLPSEYFLLFLEDYFIRKSVKTNNLLECFYNLKKLKGGYLRLRPFPKPDRHLSAYPNIGFIDKGAPYRLALQVAIWRKDVFLELVQTGESAWDMELKGSRRSDLSPVGFYCTWKPIIEYQSAITLGKWSPKGIKICAEEKIQIDFTKRPKMETHEIKKLYSSKVLNEFINIIPWKLRRMIKRVFYARK
jgi:hypothetical protein